MPRLAGRQIVLKLGVGRKAARPRHPLPLILLSGRLHDHEVFLLAWSVLLGVTFVLGAPMPASLGQTVPHGVFVGWAGVLTLSGLLGLLGSFWRGRLDVALEIERAALLMQSGVWILFAGCIVVVAGPPGVPAAGIVLAWALANLTRAYRIHRALKADRLQQQHEAPTGG